MSVHSGSRLCYCYNTDCFYRVLWSVMPEGEYGNLSVKQTLTFFFAVSVDSVNRVGSRTVKHEADSLPGPDMTDWAHVHV